MRNFTPVNRDTNQLWANRYSCQNILLNEVTRRADGHLVRCFPHGFSDDDHCISAYSDRMEYSVLSDLMKESMKGSGCWEHKLMNASPEELMAFAEKLTDGRSEFCGKRPEGEEVTACRIIRSTNVSSGFGLYLFLVLCVKPKNLKKVLSYEDEAQRLADSGLYDVDGYGHLTKKKFVNDFDEYGSPYGMHGVFFKR